MLQQLGNYGKSRRRNGRTLVGARQSRQAHSSAIARRRASRESQGVELVDGDWNYWRRHRASAQRRRRRVCDVACCLGPLPDYKEAKSVIANYVEALTKAAPPRVVALSSMGADRTSRLGMITALSLLRGGLRDLTSPSIWCARPAPPELPRPLVKLPQAAGNPPPSRPHHPTVRYPPLCSGETNDIRCTAGRNPLQPASSVRARGRESPSSSSR